MTSPLLLLLLPLWGTMLNFSIVVSGSAAAYYLLDTHRANALHILALSNSGKNMVHRVCVSAFFTNGIIMIIFSRGVKDPLLVLEPEGCEAV
ncbi:hypothetical protein V8D89_007931 [Ganoderma adspersum]